MTTLEFLSYLRSQNITLVADGEQLRCQAPRGVLTPSLQADIAVHKADILALLRGAQPAAQAALSPIMPVPRDSDLPLSFAQQRLWLLDHLQPGTSIYNIPGGFRLQGTLNVSALEQSLNDIVRRHEVLRTTFVQVGENPVQVIAASLVLALPMIDLRALPAAERETEAQQRAIEEAEQCFDLARDPLIRAKLLRLAEEEHILLLTMHHIASDGWSHDVLKKELTALYAAFLAGQPSPLPELPIQYADFAAWQRQWLQGEVLESQLTYWKGQLDSAPSGLELPLDRPRPPVQTYGGASHPLVLSKTVTEALRVLSLGAGATLFMTLLAAFQTLLYRYTGQDDIVVGSPIANRTRVEVDGLIGFFVNSLVLRTDLSRTPSFRDLLARVREVALEAYVYQELPFEKLVEELRPTRDLSHHPLFQVMFVLEDDLRQPLTLQGLTLSPFQLRTGPAKFDITLMMWNTELGLRGSLKYNTDLFDAATIARMVSHFQVLLDNIVADPDQSIATLPLLTASERQQQLVAWNAAQTAYPHEACIHQLFEAQVERSPDAVAVIFEDQSLTYRALNRRANQLAHHLRTFRVGPAIRVGICVERSLEMVVGFLGILKAGGAYVPLDPTHPPERLAFILADAQVSVLLTQLRLVEGLSASGARVIYLDADWPTIAQECEASLISGATADNLAYVIYTSGSTGQPKGVAIPHRAVARLVCNTNYIQLDPSDCVAQASNTAFDAATFEIWGALLHGARLVGVSQDVMLSPQVFADHLRQCRISTLFVTTALFNQLVDAVPGVFRSVRHLLFGGEAVDPGAVGKVLQHGPPHRLLHVYGPTESTTFVSWHGVQEVPTEALTVPIGRPIANTQLYLVDPHLQPVPVGVPGELCIGGDGLAQGYLNHPALTAETFIPHLFSNVAGARLYKTGDLARYGPDGAIEFLGRRDYQVKLRGFRIELGEIEAVLAQHPAVQANVVVVREELPGEKGVVAYVVPRLEPPPSSHDLRHFVQQKLPDYMVPLTFVRLDRLPLTPNGKIDRSRLPVPERERPGPDAPGAAPRDEVERQLATLWENLLGIEPIGMQDNFFALGGHSLRAMHLLARIETVFGQALSPLTLFQAQTVEQLAGVLRQEAPPVSGSVLAVQPTGTKPPFFYIYPGYTSFVDLVRHLGSDQPVYTLLQLGLDGTQMPASRIEDMAAHGIAEIRRICPEGPYALGGGCIGGRVAFEMAQQLHSQGHPVLLLALFDTPAMKRLGVSPSARKRRHGFAKRANAHVEHLVHLGVQARCQYVLTKVKQRVTRRLWKLGYAWFRRHGRPLPQVLQDVMAINGEAVKRYMPQVYPGRITYFWARETPPDSSHGFREGWDKIAGGGFDFHEVPGDSDTMIREPHVQVLAEKLRLCLHEGCTNR